MMKTDNPCFQTLPASSWEEDTISSVCFVIALLTWGGFVAFWYAADEPAAAGRADAVTPDDLAQALRRAVLAQRFEMTADAMQAGAPLGWHPSIDLAVMVFPRDAAPVAANVLFSREHPDGLVARFDATTGAVSNIAFQADVRNAAGDSYAWLPGADWSRIDFPAWFGAGPRFVAQDHA